MALKQKLWSGSTASKQKKLITTRNQETPDLTWFDNMPTFTEGRGEIFIEKREKNTRVTRISLSHNSQW